ncbi:ThuA domain-containing protein [Aliifodinibius sp. S!AR15-10]|uniref:ThuA domain-containing protein n=1 Tax=Aliifodinibius sp. S!AR15-10 TaxID=2950437 RepID=UPI002858F33E|nr:ThuA domain-containing protein [Aliifodinibius sp. S!AR15-10]MDR8392982.1 ThuA domain-containing protein [Aliifodinibius sp. S!AR15-10]
MKNSVLFLTISFFLLSICAVPTTNAQNADNASLLVFTKTDGWRHKSIPAGVKALKEIGADNGYAIDHTEDATVFNEQNLSQYDAVVFLNTTENILNEQQQDAFEQYVTNGGGFVGIHAASDTEYDWPWYNKLVGAYFNGHPEVQEATVRVVDQSHPSTQHLPKEWVRTDEWYNFKNIQDHLNVLAYLDESTYEGGTNGDNHPAAWYHETLGGRAFYTAGGHTSECYSNPMFRQHLLGGIQYVLDE